MKQEMMASTHANADEEQEMPLGVEQDRIQDTRQAETAEDQNIRPVTNRLRISNNSNAFIPLLVFLREKNLINLDWLS